MPYMPHLCLCCFMVSIIKNLVVFQCCFIFLVPLKVFQSLLLIWCYSLSWVRLNSTCKISCSLRRTLISERTLFHLVLHLTNFDDLFTLNEAILNWILMAYLLRLRRLLLKLSLLTSKTTLLSNTCLSRVSLSLRRRLDIYFSTLFNWLRNYKLDSSVFLFNHMSPLVELVFSSIVGRWSRDRFIWGCLEMAFVVLFDDLFLIQNYDMVLSWVCYSLTVLFSIGLLFFFSPV